ncbi:MAG: hypothetical protein ABI200_01820 [Gaiellales bacterium]
MHVLLTLVLLVPPILGAWAWTMRRGFGPRVGFALALLAWNTWAVLISELLSIGGGDLRGWTLSVAWAVPSIAAVGYLALRGPRPTALVHTIRARWLADQLVERLAVVIVAITGALIFLVGIVSAPNNWDSMSYHLARVSRWTDLHQVTHYATGIDPQLYQPPGAEIGILQWFVLDGGDRFAFIGQWLAWVGVVLLAHRAAQLLGASLRGRTAALLLAATIPMAMLQGSSTQNDLTLALWLLLAATLALGVAREPSTASDSKSRAREDSIALLLAALALGFAVLTKGTGTMLGAPVGALLLIAAVKRFGVLRGAALAIVGAVILVLPNVGAWHRNIDTYGSPFATGVHGSAYRVLHPTAGTIASNLLRNSTNHMDLPGDWWNHKVLVATERIDNAIGQDANDPATTFEQQPFKVGPYGPHEDHAGSFLLLLLSPIALVLASFRALRWRRPADDGWQFEWLMMILIQVLLFSTFLTWQNWHARLHLPMEVLFVPLVGALFDRGRWRWLLNAAVIVSVAMAPIYLFGNVTRPLIGADSILTHSRTYTQFIPRPQLRTPYEAAVQTIRASDEHTAGIVTGVDEWEYPLFKLGAQASPEVKFEDVSQQLVAALPPIPAAAIANVTSTTRPADHLPNEIVCLSCSAQQAALLAQQGFVIHHIAGDGTQPGRGDDLAAVDFYVRPQP